MDDLWFSSWSVGVIMQIISEAKLVERIHRERSFSYKINPTAGFRFPCDELGIIDTEELSEIGNESYQQCLSGIVDGDSVVDDGIESWEANYTEPAVGLCDHCGCEVSLGHFTNTCHDCGADYSMSGDRLASRSQWGEETGEHWSDCY